MANAQVQEDTKSWGGRECFIFEQEKRGALPRAVRCRSVRSGSIFREFSSSGGIGGLIVFVNGILCESVQSSSERSHFVVFIGSCGREFS